MPLATIQHNGKETAAVVGPKGVVLVETINSECSQTFETDLFTQIQTGQRSATTGQRKGCLFPFRYHEK